MDSTPSMVGPVPLRSELDDSVSLLIESSRESRIVRLRQGHALTIGRGSDADVTLADTLMSRIHARIQLTAHGECWIEDLGSTNGTFLDGRPIRRSTVNPGAEIVFGNVRAVLLRAVDAQ